LYASKILDFQGDFNRTAPVSGFRREERLPIGMSRLLFSVHNSLK